MDDEDAFSAEHGAVLDRLRQRRGECPEPERLVALAHDDVTVDERALLSAHLSLCARCAREVELIAAGAEDVTEPVWERAERGLDARPAPWRVVPRPRRARLAWLAAAAGLILAVAVVWRSQPVDPPDPTTRGAGIQVVQPSGSVSALDRFEWAAPPVRARFRVEVRRDSEPIWRSEAPGSPLEAPPELLARLRPGVTYSWRVAAMGRDQEPFLQSDWTSFRIAP
jgi:hypothetical protein